MVHATSGRCCPRDGARSLRGACRVYWGTLAPGGLLRGSLRLLRGVTAMPPYVSYLMVMILSRVEHASILFLLQRVSPIVHLGGGSTCHSAWAHFQRFLRARMLEAMSSDGEDR